MQEILLKQQEQHMKQQEIYMMQQQEQHMKQQELYMKQQEEQFLKLQEQLVASFTEKWSVKEDTTAKKSSESLMSQIQEFCYNAEAGVTFEAWFKKYEDLFQIDLADCAEEKRVRLMLRKLGAAEYERFLNNIWPKKSSELKFSEAVSLLTRIFGVQK